MNQRRRVLQGIAAAVACTAMPAGAGARSLEPKIQRLVDELGELVFDSGPGASRELRVRVLQPERLHRCLCRGSTLPGGTVARGNELHFTLESTAYRVALEVA